MRVPPKILGFLFGLTRAEIERSIEPDSDKRSDVGTTIGSDRNKPEQLSHFKQAARFFPRGGHSGRVAKSRINGGDRFVHHDNSSWGAVSTSLAATFHRFIARVLSETSTDV